MANNIKSQLFSGVFYTALAKYSGVFISLVVTGILARLLSPDDFGIVAVATVIIAFFNLLTDMGVSPAIIQHKSLTKDDLSDIFHSPYGQVSESVSYSSLLRGLLPIITRAILYGLCVNCCLSTSFCLCHHRAGSIVLPEQRI